MLNKFLVRVPAALTAALAALITLAALAGPVQARTGGDAEKTLSPYFHIAAGDGAVESFPLLDTKVNAEITGVIARVAVVQRYTNRGTEPINAQYVFPASTRAAVHGLTMTIGDRVVRAEIKEKQEAAKIYEEARAAGKNASLLEQQRPNVFRMRVANIMPGDSIDVELEYSELLVPERGIYEFMYPTVVGPRYGAGEGESDGWTANPYLKSGDQPGTGFDMQVRLAAGMALKEVACPSHAVKIDYKGTELAEISLDGKEFGGDRDYILRYRTADKHVASGLMLLEGHEENFFLLMAQPPERVTPAHIPGREYIFVVDVSGSMYGFPLDTTKELLSNLIGSLRPEDKFNLLLFSGGNRMLAPSSLAATPENIRHALAVLDNENGGGGTELLPALRNALQLEKTAGFSRSIVVVTDGYVYVEREAYDLIRESLGESNLFAFGIGSGVNRHLIEMLARAGGGEPFVVTHAGEAREAAARFKEYIASPVLTDIKVRFDGFDAYDVEPVAVPDLFADRPVLVFGKWRGAKKGRVVISGVDGSGVYEQRFDVDAVPASSEYSGLRSLWARERLARIGDFAGPGERDQNRAEITALGLKYNLLTEFTSFVAVSDVVRHQGQAENVKQPLPLPKGVSEQAVAAPAAPMALAFAGAFHKTPEPELLLLLALGSGAALLWWSRARQSATARKRCGQRAV